MGNSTDVRKVAEITKRHVKERTQQRPPKTGNVNWFAVLVIVILSAAAAVGARIASQILDPKQPPTKAEEPIEKPLPELKLDLPSGSLAPASSASGGASAP